MKEEKSKHFNSPFDDTSLPIYDLSTERAEYIEKKLSPEIQVTLNKFKEENKELLARFTGKK